MSKARLTLFVKSPKPEKQLSTASISTRGRMLQTVVDDPHFLDGKQQMRDSERNRAALCRCKGEKQAIKRKSKHHQIQPSPLRCTKEFELGASASKAAGQTC